MADEGGYSGAIMDGQESEGNFGKTMSAQKEIRSWLEMVVSLALLGMAGYYALRDLRKKERPKLRIVPNTNFE